MKKKNKATIADILEAYNLVEADRIPLKDFAAIIDVHPDTVKKRYPDKCEKKEGDVWMIKTKYVLKEAV